MPLADAGEVAHRLSETEVIAYVLVDLALIVAKWGVSAFTGPAVGLSWRGSNASGVLVNSRGLEILIVGLIGLQAGVLTEQMMAVFVWVQS